MPRLLVDSDIFCKLGLTGLLEPAVAIFDVALGDSACLPALPHMLRRGKLPKLFGTAECEALIPLAEKLSAMPIVTASLDRLANVDRIDVGEAHIFSAVADLGMVAR